ncbi:MULTISPECIES: extracellular solute-binding protein [Rhizobium/Agrobacterium group]|uniref:Extracellular solute-binding protein n=1 Tax=Neorhizobium petrolearium TaxID=515361 RepID=A0ABY8M2W6_9HYPH|nr:MULTISPECIES: extracellular solute-binding protein [Rhizobium/Agrobacterium group]MCC2612947.1 extracellular solute-binding protein [Neorhizobium petrolearium]WGI68051.1 extracellular solute-binding protein [Neorhizobium petrolearium]
MKHVFSYVAGFVPALVLAAGIAGAAEMTDGEKQLYEAAKKEGSVTWYVSQTTTEFADGMCNLFEKKYAGVECNVVRASGQVIFQRLVQELQAKAVQGDLMSTNDDGQMLQLKEQGALAQFAPENLKDMVPVLRDMADKENYWITSGVSPLVIAYNTKLVTEAEAPKNWTDLTDPKWKGQVAVGHPSFSGSVGLWTIMMNDLYGWDFFEKLEKNAPQIGRSVADGHNLVVSGERKVALAPLPLILSDAAAKKAPIAVVYPTDGALLPPSATGILKDAPHPNAARLFENFLLGPEIAEYFSKDYRYPLRAGVPLAEGMRPLDSYKTRSIETTEGISKLPDIQEKFRDTFGI